MKNEHSCSLCYAPLASSNEGLDTYDEGFAILPDGCYRSEDLVCIDCYETKFYSCEACEARVHEDDMEGPWCKGCEPQHRERYLVKFRSYSGLEWEEEADDLAEARALLADLVKKAQEKGLLVSEGTDEAEILEPEDAVLVPDSCGFARIATYTKANRRRR